MVDKLTERSSVEECTENFNEAEIAEITLFEHGNECVCSYTICVIFAVIALTISIGIGACFVYYKYINSNKENVSKYDYVHYFINYSTNY